MLRFTYELAGHLHMSVRQLFAQLEPEEWALWQAIWAVEGLGPRRDDIRAGIVASAIGNFAGKMTEKQLSPADFMPDPWNDEQPQGPDVDDKLRHRFLLMRNRK